MTMRLKIWQICRRPVPGVPTMFVIILLLFLFEWMYRRQRSDDYRQLPPCLDVPASLVNNLTISFESPTYEQLELEHVELEAGGRWRPSSCAPVHKVALLVPLRDRDEHLRTFLNHMHTFMQRQQLDYGLYVIEQAPGLLFNRGMLFNIGYVEALKQRQWDCFIFHDVDYLPENDHNLYSCPTQPRHLAAFVDINHYWLMFNSSFGGVCALGREHYRLVNGFPNLYFGWGQEDDDLYKRVIHAGLNVIRYNSSVARYRTQRHRRSALIPGRYLMLHTAAQRFATDGLSSLAGNYRVKVEMKKLFTWIYAELKNITYSPVTEPGAH